MLHKPCSDLKNVECVSLIDKWSRRIKVGPFAEATWRQTEDISKNEIRLRAMLEITRMRNDSPCSTDVYVSLLVWRMPNPSIHKQSVGVFKCFALRSPGVLVFSVTSFYSHFSPANPKCLKSWHDRKIQTFSMHSNMA